MDNIQLCYIDNEINKIDKMKQGDVIYKNGMELLVVLSYDHNEPCKGCFFYKNKACGSEKLILAVNKNGDEVILNNAPARQGEIWTDERSAHDEEYFSVEDHNSAIVLPRGTIYKLAGRHLTWEDDPISLKSFIEEHPHIDIELCKKEFFLLDEELESFKEFLNDSTKNIYHSIDGVKIVKSENGGLCGVGRIPHRLRTL